MRGFGHLLLAGKYPVIFNAVRALGWKVVGERSSSSEDKVGNDALTACNVHWVDVANIQVGGGGGEAADTPLLSLPLSPAPHPRHIRSFVLLLPFFRSFFLSLSLSLSLFLF